MLMAPPEKAIQLNFEQPVIFYSPSLSEGLLSEYSLTLTAGSSRYEGREKALQTLSIDVFSISYTICCFPEPAGSGCFL